MRRPRTRNILFAALLLVALLVTLFFSQIRLGALALLFIHDLLDDAAISTPGDGTLAWVTPVPSVKSLKVPASGRDIVADLYFIPDGKRRAAILLTHGIIESGKDDPRLVRFARSLARSGFVVFVPELEGMKALKVDWRDIDDLVVAFRYFADLTDVVREERMGLMGFSYAAGPTLMAAANREIRHRVKFVVSFGGYYDPINVIRFITTGYYEYRDEKGILKPEPYGKWVFFTSNLDYVESPKDRRLLREIFAKEQEGKREEASPALGELTPQGRSLYELLINEDPGRVAALVEKIDPRVRDFLARLSLAPVVPSIDAYIIVGHGAADPLIPYTESLRLADAVPDQSKVHVAILRLFTHVDPARGGSSVKEFFAVRLPSMVDFYFLVYDLLRQQRG